MAKRRPSILQGLQLDGEGIEASAPDVPTPVKSRPAIQHTSIYVPREAHRPLPEVSLADTARCTISFIIDLAGMTSDLFLRPEGRRSCQPSFSAFWLFLT
jgi:hypothetical protein